MPEASGRTELSPSGSGRGFAQCSGREYESAVLHTELGLRELAQGRADAAITAFRQALALAPDLAPVHNNLGLAFKQLGRVEDTEQAYRAALLHDPGYAPAHHNLGELLQRRGSLAEARECFEAALRANPGLNQSLVSLGNTLADLGDLQGAVRCYREALGRGAAPKSVHMNLGIVLLQLGELEASVAELERAVAADPRSAEAHFDLACARLQCGKAEAAVQSAREALRLRPGLQEARKVCATGMAAAGNPEAAVALLQQAELREWPKAQLYLMLASLLVNARLLEPARRCVELALRESPDDPMARHVFAALTGANPQAASGQYVRQLFDASAATFDRDLVTNLGYGIPGEMVRALRSLVREADTSWDVLDLGCGTGLVGVEIAPYSRRLVGIDLSPGMIEQARGRRIYSELHCTDILTALTAATARQERYHVVTAADVFVYIGRLDELISAVHRVLDSGGLFTFSVEASEGSDRPAPQGYRLGLMGRYTHRLEYLQSLARRHEFEIELLRQTPIRLERQRPVQGWLTIWRSSAARS